MSSAVLAVVIVVAAAGAAWFAGVGTASAAPVVRSHRAGALFKPLPGAPLPSPPSPALRPLLIQGQQTKSTNWSGYVATAGGFTHVFSRWHIPTVTTTGGDRYSATWAGIGGYFSGQLIQAGTEQDSVGGHAIYYAWYEILPEPETPISMTVHPGDSMTVDISEGQCQPPPPAIPVSCQWTIVISDESTGQSNTTSLTYSDERSSADWIHEAPTVNGFQAQLTKTGKVFFDNDTANGKTIKNAGGFDTVILVNNNGGRVATPGKLDSDGDGFGVANGGKGPAPPAS